MSHFITGYVYDTMVYYALAKRHAVRNGKSWADVLDWANNAVQHNVLGA